MASHTLRLIYDGLDAANYKMPASLVKQITAGAQEFLAAHAYFFTEGRIPENVNDHSRFFHIHDRRRRQGSWEAIFAIDLSNVAAEFVTEYVKELSKNLAVEAALATKVGFVYLVLRSYKAWQNRRPLADSTFDRIEPVFTEAQGNGAPIFDPAAESERQRRLLFERTNSSMSKMTAPIGRAATHLDILLDDEKLGQHQRRFVSEEEITVAVRALRKRMEAGERRPRTRQ